MARANGWIGIASVAFAAGCGSAGPAAHEGGFYVPDEGRVVSLTRADAGRETRILAPQAAPGFASSVAQIEPGRLVAPLVVIDVVMRTRAARDFAFGTDDLAEFEGRCGAIPAGAFVALATGAGAGRHPGFASVVVELLARQRGVVGFGSDAPAVDPSSAAQPDARRAAVEAGRFVVTNLAGLDQVVGGRAIVFLGAPLAAAPEAPLRVLAIVPRQVAQSSGGRPPNP